MAGDPDEVEVIDVVTSRLEFLEVLSEPLEKRELVDRLGVSRSTVNRSVRELESLGLVTRDEGYRLTVTGEMVMELFRDFLAGVRDVAAARELLALVPPEAPMNLAMLRGATVRIAEPPSPAATLEPVLDAFRRTERMRGISVGATRPDRTLAVIEDRVAAGATFEYVFSESMAGYLRTEYRRRIRDLMATGRFEMYTLADLPYGLGLAEVSDGRRCFLALYDDDSLLQGVALNDSREAWRWSEDVYERYRSEAERLSPP